MKRLSGVPYLDGFHYLNQSQKDWYLRNVRSWTLTCVIGIALANFDNWLGKKVRR
jgi:hypothetical protein